MFLDEDPRVQARECRDDHDCRADQDALLHQPRDGPQLEFPIEEETDDEPEQNETKDTIDSESEKNIVPSLIPFSIFGIALAAILLIIAFYIRKKKK